MVGDEEDADLRASSIVDEKEGVDEMSRILCCFRVFCIQKFEAVGSRLKGQPDSERLPNWELKVLISVLTNFNNKLFE
jgi:hypothetical protein